MRKADFSPIAGPSEDDLDKVMSRAVSVARCVLKNREAGVVLPGGVMASLPGTALPAVFREDHAAALGALRELVRKDWLGVLRALQWTVAKVLPVTSHQSPVSAEGSR